MKKTIAAVLLLCLIAGSVTHAFALTSTEKEEMYSAAVLELESYLENAGNSSEELVGILSAFDTFSGYEQSRFLGYYVRVLQRIADEGIGKFYQKGAMLKKSVVEKWNNIATIKVGFELGSASEFIIGIKSDGSIVTSGTCFNSNSKVNDVFKKNNLIDFARGGWGRIILLLPNDTIVYYQNWIGSEADPVQIKIGESN